MSSYKDYRLSSDTTPEAERLFFELLGQKSPAERLQMVCQTSSTMRVLTMTGLRQRYPQETDGQLKVRLAELLYGADVAHKIADRLKSNPSNE